MISVLTPTGARPEAFAACVDMMRAQDYDHGMVRWVIVDDGPDPMETPDMPSHWRVTHVMPEPSWEPGQNTLARNLLVGLEERSSNRVVIVEDDDMYSADWLTTCNLWLEDADLVGESHSLYRHRATGRETAMRNTEHASLCSTALKGPAIETLREVCAEGAKGIDMRLWKRFQGVKRLHAPEPRRVVGVKGWGGRPGLGVGHRLA